MLPRWPRDLGRDALLLFDHEGQAEARWKAEHLPTHVVLDANGKEIARSGELNATITESIAVLVSRRGQHAGRER